MSPLLRVSEFIKANKIYRRVRGYDIASYSITCAALFITLCPLNVLATGMKVLVSTNPKHIVYNVNIFSTLWTALEARPLSRRSDVRSSVVMFSFCDEF